MKVTAAPGTRCPMENKPRAYIGDADAVEVADSAYYRRLVADGSLIEETRPKEQGQRKKEKKEE